MIQREGFVVWYVWFWSCYMTSYYDNISHKTIFGYQLYQLQDENYQAKLLQYNRAFLI